MSEQTAKKIVIAAMTEHTPPISGLADEYDCCAEMIVAALRGAGLLLEGGQIEYATFWGGDDEYRSSYDLHAVTYVESEYWRLPEDKHLAKRVVGPWRPVEECNR